MPRFPVLHRRASPHQPKGASNGLCGIPDLLWGAQGSSLLEFAITLPLLVVFVVGIYDFSGAFNQKQKIAQAAQAFGQEDDITVVSLTFAGAL